MKPDGRRVQSDLNIALISWERAASAAKLKVPRSRISRADVREALEKLGLSRFAIPFGREWISWLFFLMASIAQNVSWGKGAQR